MPTTAEHPSRNLTHQHTMYSTSHSWTDDLPVCHDSAVGYSTNQIYREDGAMCKEHEFEDKSFHFRPNVDTCLYGVFDGHDGIFASHFAAQRIPADLLIGQLADNSSDHEIKNLLHQSFEAVERGFFESIDDKLAEIANLQIQLPDGLKAHDVYEQYPEVVSKWQALHAEVAGGTTAVVCLIHRNKLYVANVGDSRALLVKKDQTTNLLEVLQLSVDHNIKNEDELLRLSHLGLDVERLRQSGTLGNQENTRCIGNHKVKGCYKEFHSLSSAISEPVIAEPEIVGGIPIDDNCLFLLLMSNGLYKSLENATGSVATNEDIAKLVLEQFTLQSTLAGVVQGAVDKVVRLHHDMYMDTCSPHQTKNQQMTNSAFESYRDDITLMIRNLNMPLLNTRTVRMSGTTLTGGGLDTSFSSQTSDTQDSASGQATCNTERTVSGEDCTVDSEDSLFPETHSSQYLSGQQTLDEDGCIAPYVDFKEYYDAIAEAEKQGIDVFLDAELVDGWKNNECGVILE